MKSMVSKRGFIALFQPPGFICLNALLFMGLSPVWVMSSLLRTVDQQVVLDDVAFDLGTLLQ